MKKMTYKEHLNKWNKARELVKNHNETLIQKWKSIPWYRFWERPSFEEQRRIIMNNWSEFDKLPIPHMMDYFQIKL